MSNGPDIAVGTVTVSTTSGGGHSLEYFAERIVDRLIVVAENAPQPIRDQAMAFREQMLAIVLEGIVRAIRSDRAYRK